MKSIKQIFMCVMLVLTACLTQSCDALKDELSRSWETRHLSGAWVMVRQEFVYLDKSGNVRERVTNNYSRYPGRNREQMKLFIEREHGDEFFFSAYHAYRGAWEFDSEYRVFVEEDWSLFRYNSSVTHTSEEYIGHIDKLDYDDLVISYDCPEYEVYTSYIKVYD